MSEAATTEVSVKNWLLDVSHAILFEIFRTLPKKKLIQLSELCSKFRHVAGDTRLWEDVYIKYKPFKNYSFEELYSEPWPVKVINLSHTRISLPVSSQTERVTKVGTLKLVSVTANKVTIAAILSKYQCTEIYLDSSILEIGPEAFSKQTALEVISVQGKCYVSEDIFRISLEKIHQLLAPIFKYSRNLKTLDLSDVSIGNFDMSGFVKTLPTSLEKLFLQVFPADPFFKLLAKRTPNLRELEGAFYLGVECQSLLNLQFLETLRFHFSLSEDLIEPGYQGNISDLYKYLTPCPALKTVHIIVDDSTLNNSPETFPEKLRTMLRPHGIMVEITENSVRPPFPERRHLWEVSKW